MRPTIRQLLVFRMVLEQKSFRKTADLLHTSQPALSRTIKDLEAILETPLLVRTTRSVEPTEAGLEFYSRIVAILGDLDEAIRTTRDVAVGRRGNLRIAYMDIAILGDLPAILRAFRSAQPDVQLQVSFVDSIKQVPLLMEGSIDVGFVLEPLDIPGFRKCLIRTEGLVAVLPAGHELARNKALKLSDLADQPFVTGDARWQRYTDQVFEICRQHGFMPRVAHTAYMRDSIFGLVIAGGGVTVYPECIVDSARTGLCYVPIRDVPKIIETSAIWRDANSNPALPAFTAQLPARRARSTQQTRFERR